jgi:outer membrane lipoprotein SlyB
LLGIAVAGCVEQPAPDVQAGTILAAAPAQQAGENTGAGGATGLIVGVAAGAALGRGAGRVLGAAIGGTIGGIAGSAAESAAQSTRGAAYTVRLDTGQVVTVIQHLEANEAMLQAGARVRLRVEGRSQRVEAATSYGLAPP